MFPNQRSVAQFLDWMRTLRLGRKRTLDTMLAATHLTNGITEVVTSDRQGSALFPGLTVVDPLARAP